MEAEKAVIKTLPAKKKRGPDCFIGEFTKHSNI